jgi:hypothetical protein
MCTPRRRALLKGLGQKRPNQGSLNGGIKAGSGIGLPMVNELESTLGWIYGEVIVNSGIGSHTPCFSLNSASDEYFLWRPGKLNQYFLYKR